MCTQSSWSSPGPRAKSARLVWFVLTALDVEHETAEAVAIRLQRFEDRVGDHRELVSTKTRRYQDDPRVLRIGRDGVVSKLDELDLHRVKRTSPGYRLSIASGVIAAFASILA